MNDDESRSAGGPALGEPAWANAHLIAAAPDLRDALMYFVGAAENGWEIAEGDLVRARAALAKSKGQLVEAKTLPAPEAKP